MTTHTGLAWAGRLVVRRYPDPVSEGLSSSAEAAKSSIDRLTFFADAVVAIAMTLLAVDLPVPDATSASALWTFVGDHVAELAAFFVSFFVVAQYWRAHHRLYRYVTDAPPRLVTATMVWLLTVVLTPYATRVLWAGSQVDDSDFPIRFGFYAVVQALAAFTFMWSARIVEQAGILGDVPPDLLPRTYTRNVVLMTTFLVSIPLAVVVNVWAFLLWGLIPVWMALGVRARRQRGAP